MKEKQRSWFAPVPYGAVRVLATNGFIKKNGVGVMGRGLAYAVSKLYKGIEKRLGQTLESQGRLRSYEGVHSGKGNHVALIWDMPPILSFPTKWAFFEDSDLSLIERSAGELVRVVDGLKIPQVYLHPIGDGHTWEEVKTILNRYFDDRFIVCFGESE